MISPQLYFAVMLITNPQKARRILLAEELENWFMDLFDEEYEDIFNGTFLAKQDDYIDRIVDKYLEVTGVNINAKDKYSIEVIDKAIKTATAIQETTVKNILYPSSKAPAVGFGIPTSEGSDIEDEISGFIKAGIAFSSAMFVTDGIKRWFSKERANLIALNEANWIYNHEEFEEALGKYSKKTWYTALDERVRATHIVMEGVTIPINEPFRVGAYLMNYPLDDSLGAGLEEIINCRCTVQYS